MKRCIPAMLLCLLLLLTLAGHAEEEPRLAEGTVSRGSKQVSFLYPETYRIEEEDDIGTFVYLNEIDYITLSIPPRGLSGVESLDDHAGDRSIILSENLHLWAVNGNADGQTRNIDFVQAGVNLPDGGNVVLTAHTYHGRTAVYQVFLTILSSLTDTTLVEEWLTNEWIPYITAQP